MATKRLLVVEGEEDKKLFTSLSRAFGITNIDVVCSTPGKGNAIRTLCQSLAMQTRASDARIGAVVDADFPADGGGFAASLAELNSKLSQVPEGPLRRLPGGGFDVGCTKGPKLKSGVWVMPDNASDGYVEHFFVRNIAKSEIARFAYTSAQCATALDPAQSGLTFPVRSMHVTKAEVGMWLALQDPPRMSLAKASSCSLLDLRAPLYSQLEHWMKWLFL